MHKHFHPDENWGAEDGLHKKNYLGAAYNRRYTFYTYTPTTQCGINFSKITLKINNCCTNRTHGEIYNFGCDPARLCVLCVTRMFFFSFRPQGTDEPHRSDQSGTATYLYCQKKICGTCSKNTQLPGSDLRR